MRCFSTEDSRIVSPCSRATSSAVTDRNQTRLLNRLPDDAMSRAAGRHCRGVRMLTHVPNGAPWPELSAALTPPICVHVLSMAAKKRDF